MFIYIIIIKINCKRQVQIQNLQGIFTRCTRGARNAPMALEKTPQRCHGALSDMLCKRQAATAFVLSMFKINTAAWRSRRLHSVSTALLATAQCAPRRSTTFFKAVRTLLWCDTLLDKWLICLTK